MNKNSAFLFPPSLLSSAAQNAVGLLKLKLNNHADTVHKKQGFQHNSKLEI